MQSKKLVTGLLTAGTVIALLLAVASATAGPPAQGPDTASGMTLAGTVASKISYQGRLTDAGGNPLNGSFNLVFQLWDDATTGSQVGSDVVKNGVAVSSGLFTVELDVPHSAFNGQALWLWIQVNGQWLSPRQELLPVPYALSLRPGARIEGSSTNAIASVINQGLGVALYAQGAAMGVEGVGMTGVRGEGDVGVRGAGLVGVRGDSETGPGVQGTSVSGYGVVGSTSAPMTATAAAGVYGESANGHGVEGRSQFDVGVYGESSGGFGAGVQGAGMTGVFGTGGLVGVSGYTTNDDTTGVLGTATGYGSRGVEGNAQFGTGVVGTGEIGVKGTSSVGPGVRGEGSIGVEGSSQIGDGVVGSTQGDWDTAAVRGSASGNAYGGHFTSANSTGVYGNSSTGNGVEGRSTSGTGVFGFSASAEGVVGNSQSGVAVYGNTGSGTAAVMGEGPKGVYGKSSADGGEGVRGDGLGQLTEGVLGSSAYAHGVGGYSSGTNGGLAIGVYGQTAATWGLATNQNLYVGGSCTGCTIVFVGKNSDPDPLEVGDVVAISGIAPPLKGQQTPILEVRRATAVGSSALGVVRARAAVTATETPVLGGDSNQTATIEMPGLAPGSVAPGDYLFVVVQGLVQVRADASSGAIQVGDPVGPAALPSPSGRGVGGEGGLAQKLDPATPVAPVLGRALEPLDKGTGLIWVLVLGR